MQQEERIIRKTSRSRIAAVILLSLSLCFGGYHAFPATAATLSDQINTLNKEVTAKKKELQSLNKKIEQFRNSIAKKQAESASLEEAVGLLDNQIAAKVLDIEIAQQEINQSQLEIEEIQAEVKAKEEELARQRDALGVMARRLYQQGYKRSPLEILATHSTFSDFFDDLHAIFSLEDEVKKRAETVKTTMNTLKEDQVAIEAKQTVLEEHKRTLQLAQNSLEEQRQFKTNLLIETQQSELNYRYMLADLKREQSDADSEISGLERSLRDNLAIADRLKGEGTILSWPLVASRGLSTLFRDPSYPFRNVFEHPGIDIPAPQGTPVRAAAAGVVARAKDAGMGYSYVMIIHNNNIATVYGHLSRISAKEDTFVERGEVIGYSGGKPGTPGAGTMTTGPHLHFETRVSGIPSNPLSYLIPSGRTLAGE